MLHYHHAYVIQPPVKQNADENMAALHNTLNDTHDSDQYLSNSSLFTKTVLSYMCIHWFCLHYQGRIQKLCLGGAQILILR